MLEILHELAFINKGTSKYLMDSIMYATRNFQDPKNITRWRKHAHIYVDVLKLEFFEYFWHNWNSPYKSHTVAVKGRGQWSKCPKWFARTAKLRFLSLVFAKLKYPNMKFANDILYVHLGWLKGGYDHRQICSENLVISPPPSPKLSLKSHQIWNMYEVNILCVWSIIGIVRLGVFFTELHYLVIHYYFTWYSLYWIFGMFNKRIFRLAKKIFIDGLHTHTQRAPITIFYFLLIMS